MSAILAMARYRAGGAIDPIATYQASDYRKSVTEERPSRRAPARGDRLKRVQETSCG